MNEFWKDKRVLITGNTGFKGSWLSLWLLKKGALVWGGALGNTKNYHLFNNLLPSFDKEFKGKFRNISVDINHLNDLNDVVSLSKPDIVFHLAAQPLVLQSYKEPLKTFQTNIIGSLNLLEALKKSKKRCAVIIVTTDKVYEDKKDIYSYREIDPLGGYDPYSASKAALEICVNSWRNSFCKENESNLLISTARAGNVIGGGDWSKYRIVPDLVNAIKNNTSLELRNPFHIRPWQHVLEPLDGYIRLAELMFSNKETHNNSKYNCAFNFGPDISTKRSVECLVKEFSKYYDLKYCVKRIEEKFYESKLLTLSSEKARMEIDWQPVWDFEETVKKTATWYKNFFNDKNAYECCIKDINDYDFQNSN